MKKQRIRRILAAALAVCLCFALTGCGKEDGEKSSETGTEATATPAPTAETAAATAEPTAAPTEEATATAEPEKVTVEILYEDEPVTELSFMTSTVFPLKANVSSGDAGTWTSSDASVASVDENGVVTCWKVGKPRITYTVGDASGSVELTVSEATVKITYGGVEKTDISLSATWGYEIQLEAEVSPAGAEYTWSSEDATIATVSSTGLVSALRGGNTNIVCKCGTAKAACVIRVLGTPPTQQEENASATPDPNDTTPRIIITYAGSPNTDFTTPVGTSVDMNYVLRNLPENSAVTWTIKDTAIATVNADGVVTGVSAGTTTLTAKCGDVSCDCIVRITKNS